MVCLHRVRNGHPPKLMSYVRKSHWAYTLPSQTEAGASRVPQAVCLHAAPHQAWNSLLQDIVEAESVNGFEKG